MISQSLIDKNNKIFDWMQLWLLNHSTLGWISIGIGVGLIVRSIFKIGRMVKENA